MLDWTMSIIPKPSGNIRILRMNNHLNLVQILDYTKKNYSGKANPLP